MEYDTKVPDRLRAWEHSPGERGYQGGREESFRVEAVSLPAALFGKPGSGEGEKARVWWEVVCVPSQEPSAQ